MRYVAFDSGGTRDYHNIALHAMEGEEVTEVTEQEYFYMLEVLPPIYAHGVPGGFMVMEATTDSREGPVHAQYAKIDDRYYAKWVVKGNHLTYIRPEAVRRGIGVLPIDEDHARIAREQYEDMFS